MLHLLLEFVQRAKACVIFTLVAPLTVVIILHIADKFISVGIDPRLNLDMYGASLFTYEHIRMFRLFPKAVPIVNGYRSVYQHFTVIVR